MNKPRLLFCFSLVLVGLWLFINTLRWDDAVRKFDAAIEFVNAAEGKTAEGRKIYLENDSYYWMAFARQIATGEGWRIRHTDADNAPYGREVHWSQSISWLLVAAGFVAKIAGIQDWTFALEAGSIWINPVLHFLLIAGSAFVVARRFGVLPAILLAVLLLSFPDVNWAFMPLRPDHQTLHLAFAFGSFLVLTVAGLGWTSGQSAGPKWKWRTNPVPPDRASAKRQFAMAGVLTGMGMWVGATPQLFVIGSLVAASLLLYLSLPIRGEIQTEKAAWKFTPELWRVWGWTAGAVSIFFYLLEYAPGPFRVRLEVNHPVYTILLVACGEFLAAFGYWQIFRKPLAGIFFLRFALSAALCAGIVLLIVFAPHEWFGVKHPYMIRLHNFIGEFYTFPNFAKGRVLTKIFTTFGLFPLTVAGAIWLLFFRRWNGYFVALLGFPLLGTLALIFAGFMQVRWTAFASAFLGFQAVALLVVLYGAGFRWTKIGLPVLAGVMALNAGLFLKKQNNDLLSAEGRKEFVTDVGQMVLFKRLSLLLGEQFAGKNVRMLAEPNIVPSMQWFSGIPGVTSFYWENLDGLIDTADAFSDDKNGEKARDICEKRGLTHILVTKGLFVPKAFYFVKSGDMDSEEAKYTFLGQLMSGNGPDWVKRAPEQSVIEGRSYRFSNALVKHEFRIYSLSP